MKRSYDETKEKQAASNHGPRSKLEKPETDIKATSKVVVVCSSKSYKFKPQAFDFKNGDKGNGTE